MDRKKRRLSVGDALKKAANELEDDVNDDEAEIAERRKTRVESAQVAKAPTISAEITSSWLRIFSEGKLGKKDVWNVPVTDMLAKEGQSETVDFRDASLTIDASAHVYSKRVEEVLSKTTTLAGGLASEDLESFEHLPEDEEEKAGADDEADATAKEEVKAKKKRESKRGVNTLETNEASLVMKRNEREYAIDPLFHKRSAIFDSGGAKGLLLNVLSVHNGFQLVFDSSDLVDDSEDPRPHASSNEIEAELHKLITASLPAHWQDSPICPEYAERRKGNSDEVAQIIAEAEDEPYHMETDDASTYDNSNIMSYDPPAATSNAAAAGDDEDDELRVSFGKGPANPESAANANSNWTYDGGDAGDDHDDDAPAYEGFALDAQLDRIEQTEVAAAALGQPDMEYYETKDGPNAEYTYFDRDKLGNWIGPGHWKHKNIRSKQKGSAAGEDVEYQDEEGNIIKANKSKGPRKTFRIDFNAPAPANLDDLLAPAGSGAILPKQTLDKQLKEARMLMIPPDINYDISNFSATFLPHHVAVALRRRAEATAAGGNDDPWRNVEGPDMDDHDDGDQIYEDVYRGDIDLGGADASAGVALRPGDDGYLPNVAKIDKRVDVKALKSTIWKELCATSSGDSARDGVNIPTTMKIEKPFQDILEQLPLSMSNEVAREVSVPYCFVCLLHLANEKHLAIRQDGMESLFVTQTAPQWVKT